MQHASSVTNKSINEQQQELINFKKTIQENIQHNEEALNRILKQEGNPEHKQQIIINIDSIIEKIKTLPLVPNLLKQESQPTITTKNTWQEKVKENLNKLKSFVVIQKTANYSAFELSPNKKQIIVQNILMKLILSEWAVINNQQQTYQQSLNAAKNMINTIIIEKNLNAELINKINELLSTPINK